MQEWEGKKVFGGIAIGKIYVYQKGQQQVRRMTIQDPIKQQKKQLLPNCRSCMKKHCRKWDKPMQRFLRFIK